MKSINQSTVMAALDLFDGEIIDSHNKAAERLNDVLHTVPPTTLGDHPPHISRLYPTLDALVKTGEIEVVRNGKRYSRITRLKRNDQEQARLQMQGPSQFDQIIIKALGDLGGVIEEVNGRAGVMLRELVDDGASASAWRTRIEECAKRGWIIRDMQPVGAVRIELSESGTTWYQENVVPTVVEPVVQPVVELEPVPVEEEPLFPPEALGEDLNWVDELAHKLLATVVKKSKEPWVDPAEHEKLKGRIDHLQAQIAKLKDERRELEATTAKAIEDKKDIESLLRMADEDAKKLQRRLDEAQATADRLGADRDSWRKRCNEIESYIEDASQLKERRKTADLAHDLRKIITED